jgi:hypothetical protein
LVNIKKKAPVALFVYNRIEHTKKTVHALQANFGAEETDLLVFSDAAKTSSDSAQVEEVRSFIKTIKGFKSIEIFSQSQNKGLAPSIIDGVTYMMDKFGEGIIVEDDLVTSPYFLNYMNEALSIYRDNERVISIHGYVYPTKGTLPDTFFIRGADCWGWATWKRGWEHFEKDSNKLIREIEDRNLAYEFDVDNSFAYFEMLKQQAAGKISSWAIRWHASAFLKDLLTLYPGVSLVENIGNDGTGTHCGDSDMYSVKLSQAMPSSIGKIPIEESQIGRAEFIKYFRSIRPTLFFKIKNRLKSLFRKYS